MNTQAPLVIIGSGLGGYMLAKEWRKRDTKRPLEIFTLDDGSFYSKPQLSTALAQKKTPSALIITDANAMEKQLHAKIHVMTEVLAIDTQSQRITYEKEGKKEQLEYSDLVLATGAKKVSPILKGDAVGELESVNNLRDYQHFYQWLRGKQHLAIMGAGLVGCEFANDLLLAGYQLDLVDAESYPLKRLVPAPIGHGLQKAMQDKGVNWHMNNLVTEVNHEGDGYRVLLSSGSALTVDGVFCAIGIRPNVDLAKCSGIRVNRGIVVDRCLRTSAKHVYALGDCAEVNGRVYQHIAPLLQCSRALAEILVGEDQPVYYPPMTIVVKTPICPVVTSPLPPDAKGRWCFEGEGSNLKGHFYDEAGHLQGFSLLGTPVRDKISLEKQLPPVFQD